MWPFQPIASALQLAVTGLRSALTRIANNAGMQSLEKIATDLPFVHLEWWGLFCGIAIATIPLIIRLLVAQ
jgi:hypothetical protein